MMGYKIKDMQNQRVLITGGLGFLGSNLAIKLTNLGTEITLFSRTAKNIRNIREIKNDVKLVFGDITDRKTLDRIVKEKDMIFHFAGQTSHISSMENPLNDIKMNCVGVMNILEACRKVNDGAKILFPGTTGQTGRVEKSNLPITENLRDAPITVYDADKLAAEKYLMIYNKVYGMRTVSLRLATIYGERQDVKSSRYGITNMFIKKAMCGETIMVYGDGSFIRDYNYVGNVVDAFILAAQTRQTSGNYFNLGSNRPTKFIDMVKTVIEKVKEVTGKQGKFEFVPWSEKARAIDVGDVVVDYKKLRDFTGWYPKISFEDGIRKTVEFYKERLDEYL